jgi:hypothetical protein
MPELDDADKAILVELLRETIERGRFPLSPHIKASGQSWRSSIRQRRDRSRYRHQSHQASPALALAKKRRR